MGKISAMTELTVIDPSATTVLAVGGRNYKISLRDLFSAGLFSRLGVGPFSDEFWHVPTVAAVFQNQPPWIWSSALGGTISDITGIADHPGIALVRSAAAANTGGAFTLIGNQPVILLQGGEDTELILQWRNTANMLVRFGFGDTFTAIGEPTDGAYIKVNATTLTGETRNNGAGSTTGTSYVIANTTWYRIRVVVNADATRVDFYIYSMAGAQLWTDFLTTNIPKVAGRETSHGFHAYKSAVTGNDIIYVDYISLKLPKVLTR